MIDGIAVVDKPSGLTSHDVVARCRRAFGQKRVGHAGTLDPGATGVLVIGLGRATRLLQFVTGLGKSYTAEVVLGAATSTLDEHGELVGRWDMGSVTVEDARREAAALTGEIDQVPPMVSAVKVDGQRLHRLARAGVEVERRPRRVTVTRFDIDLLPGAGAGEGPVLAVEVDCSSGTYVRVLAADLGRALGGGAYLRRLRRTAVGPWTLHEAVGLDHLGPADVLGPVDALPWMEAVEVTAPTSDWVAHGRVLPAGDMGAAGPGPWRVIGPSGDLLAVYVAHRGETVKPIVVLADGS